MSFHAKVLNVLIASPSDVETERDEVEMAIYEWNRRYSEQLNVVLLPRRWENDVAPAYRGNDPQQIINDIIVHKSDILVGIFWTKLGTPTSNHSSGTLEEISQFIQANKDVMLYFLDKSVPRNNTNYAEMERVDEFKKEYSSQGIYSVYSKEKVVEHLYKTVTSQKHLNSEVVQRNDAPSNDNTSGLGEELDIEKLITSNVLTDNEILLLAFSRDSGTRHFGERWMAEQTIKNIKNWISEKELLTNLTSYYSDVINNLVDRGILIATEYTIHGNPRNYAMKLEVHDRLRNLSNDAEEIISQVIDKHYLELPF